MANLDLEDFKKFKEEAGKAGYENENAKKIKELDGSTTISYESGDWKFHDNYFGGEPYGGRIIYTYKDKPVHITVFYGWVDKEEDADEVYRFLRKSLRQPDKQEFRGPKEFKEGSLTYQNNLHGTIENFSLEEKILGGDKEIYSATFMGGLVDQRSGD